MSDEFEEEVELSAEELFEQRQAEINEMFEEKGFFARLSLMFSGLKAPPSSREYKAAKTELQRLAAPLVAILLPVIGVVALIVITAVQSERHEILRVEIAQIEEKQQEPEDIPDPPEEEIDMKEDINVDVNVVVEAAPQIPNPAPPSPNPGGEPDKVAAPPSPVTMSAVAGTVKMRGLGDGDAGGFGTLIGGGKGKGQDTTGCLIGVIIDFKSNPDGSPNPNYSVGNENHYWQAAKALVDGDFGPNVIAKYFSPDKRVALNHVFIEKQNAGNGPKAFGVDDVMKPSGFVVYYSGKIRATEKARYRFVGYFDDFMLIRLNKKVILEDNWGHKSQGKAMHVTGWASSDPENGKWPSIQGMASPLTIGDWWDAEPGKEYFLEVIVGERPGGAIGGSLFIQKEGDTYEIRKTDTTNRPILPIFASRPLSTKEKDRIRSYSYPMSVESPRFNAGLKKEILKQAMKNDVKIEVDI